MFSYKYPRPALTTDCVIFGFDGHSLQVLLIRRGIEPYKGSWALPGGFLNMTETVEECAFRELQEETNLEAEMLEQFGVFSALDRDPRERIVSVAFYALVKKSRVQAGDDAAEARWFALDDLPQLAFDHIDILREAQDALKRDIHHRPIGFKLLEKEFSMPQLQRLYEAILGVKFDRRNFQKKMLASGVINQMPSTDATEHEHRPQRRYRFREDAYQRMKEETHNAMEF